MNRNRLKKLIQAVRTGGLGYATQKVRIYVKRHLKTVRKFSWEDYTFEELPEPTDLDHKYDVSVVVPTYNGGTQFEILLQMLKQQKNCGSVEIVVVDSGSTDGTVELCKKHGVALVQIPNEQFSHSGARNLGAETAKGELLVFMTQDALPSSEEWLLEMIEPILSGEADAVSCGEECPESTELYYRILTYGHASYVGMLQEDVLGSKEKCRDKESLRRYASLSDVACAINRKAFLRFRHRYNFAEDLDLGIRLISCGYKTKLLAKTKTIHGHNRNVDYYLKRAVVEKESFNKIFSEEKIEEKADIVERKVYYSACLVAEYLKQLEKMECNEMTTEVFLKQASMLFEKVMTQTDNKKGFEGFGKENAPLLTEVVALCGQNSKQRKYAMETDLAYNVRFYLDNVAEYMKYHGITKLEYSMDTLCDCMLKQFALLVGTELAKLRKEEMWNRKILELIKGV